MTSYAEEDFLMISGIQHFLFCKRQWGLIHIEQLWKENVLTLEGNYLHEKADQPEIREKRGNKLIVRALPVHSARLGISGICDVVEFVEDDDGVPIHGSEKAYRAVPVEYKRGKPKQDFSDVMQLTAQALCLEEMLACEVHEGFLYYHEVRHREKIVFTEELREKLQENLSEMHKYWRDRHTPKVKAGKFCRNCSLEDLCVPVLMKKETVERYIRRRISE